MNENLNKININNTVDNTYIINNETSIKEELNNINIIEENISDANDEYYVQLLIQYFKIKGIKINEVLPTLIANNKCNFDSLVKMYPDFLDYISLCDKLSEHYLDYLYKSKIVDVNNNNTYEINKGEFDSVSTEDMSIVSKYAKTMGLDSSMLYRIDDKLYQVFNNGSISIIPEGSTILVHNAYSIKDITYVLSICSGLDINIVIGAWGFDYYVKNQLETLKKALDIIKILSIDSKIRLEHIIPQEKDNVMCVGVIINAKNLKRDKTYESLISNRESLILTSFLNNNIKIETKTNEGKILRR